VKEMLGSAHRGILGGVSATISIKVPSLDIAIQ
jgi:hypothetical protein